MNWLIIAPRSIRGKDGSQLDCPPRAVRWQPLLASARIRNTARGPVATCLGIRIRNDKRACDRVSSARETYRREVGNWPETLDPYRKCPGRNTLGSARTGGAGAVSIRAFEGGRWRLRRTRRVMGFESTFAPWGRAFCHPSWQIPTDGRFRATRNGGRMRVCGAVARRLSARIRSGDTREVGASEDALVLPGMDRDQEVSA